MTEPLTITWDELRMRCRKAPMAPGALVYGVPRGGCTIAALLLETHDGISIVDRPERASWIVDDLVDSGATRALMAERFPHAKWWSAFDKQRERELADRWLVFPWEHDGEETVQFNVLRLLEFIGENPERDGLRDTPDRVVRALSELTEGYRQDAFAILGTQFEHPVDEMIVVRDVPFLSLCEHHMLPFHGTATVGYVPAEQTDEQKAKVVGLSKLARLVHCFARRLQVQERLTDEIADALMEALEPRAAGAVVRASHTCMAMRGIRAGGEMVTSSLRGLFREDSAARAEFLALARNGS